MCSQSAPHLLLICFQSASNLLQFPPNFLTICSHSAANLFPSCSQSADNLLPICSGICPGSGAKCYSPRALFKVREEDREKVVARVKEVAQRLMDEKAVLLDTA